METPRIIVAGITPEGAKAGDELAKKISEKLGTPPPKGKKVFVSHEKDAIVSITERKEGAEPPKEEGTIDKAQAEGQTTQTPPQEETKKEEPKPRQRPDIEKILDDVRRLNELTNQRNTLINYKATLEGLDFKNASNAKLTLQGNGYNKTLETSNSFMLEDVREFLLTRLERRLIGVQDEISLTYAQINDPEALPF